MGPLVPLHQVARIERKTVDASAIRSGTLYVGLENIQPGGQFKDVRAVATGELASGKFAFTDKHLLYGKLRPYLAKVARPSFDGICSTDILPVLPGPRLDRGYLAHLLLTPRLIEWATERSAGANLPRLSPQALAGLPIPLPPLALQRRIADLLDGIDVIRSKRREALAKLDILAHAILVKMFGDPGINPRGLARVALKDLIERGPQNGLYRPASDYGTGLPIIRIDAFYDGVVTGLSNLKRVRVSEEEAEKYRLREGDILVNRVNSREYLGKSAIVPSLAEPTLFESNIMRLSINRDRALPSYVVAFLQTTFVRHQIQRCAKDAINQASINQQDVKGLVLNLPPIDEQGIFADRIAAVRRASAVQVESLRRLEALFASLQHLAFNGTLFPNGEPTGVGSLE